MGVQTQDKTDTKLRQEKMTGQDVIKTTKNDQDHTPKAFKQDQCSSIRLRVRVRGVPGSVRVRIRVRRVRRVMVRVSIGVRIMVRVRKELGEG